MKITPNSHDGPTSRADHRTVDAIFRHPAADTLAWRDVLSLFNAIGEVEVDPNGKVIVRIGGGSAHADVTADFEAMTDPELLDAGRRSLLADDLLGRGHPRATAS